MIGFNTAPVSFAWSVVPLRGQDKPQQQKEDTIDA